QGIWVTRFGKRLLHWLGRRRDEGSLTFVVFDGMIDAIAFEDNTRNDDVVVRQVLSELGRMGGEYVFNAYGILHPSRAGQRTGTGSYAPAWSTRPRAIQQVMENDDGIVREVIKRSHGASGAKITLRYNAGFMEPAFEGVVGGESTLDVVTDLATKKAELN